MGASSQQLEKLLNTVIPKKFPIVERIDVREEELDKHTYYIDVWVLIKNKAMFVPPNEVDTKGFGEIQKEIRELSRYVLLHINQITFGAKL